MSISTIITHHPNGARIFTLLKYITFYKIRPQIRVLTNTQEVVLILCYVCTKIKRNGSLRTFMQVRMHSNIQYMCIENRFLSSLNDTDRQEIEWNLAEWVFFIIIFYRCCWRKIMLISSFDFMNVIWLFGHYNSYNFHFYAMWRILDHLCEQWKWRWRGTNRRTRAECWRSFHFIDGKEFRQFLAKYEKNSGQHNNLAYKLSGGPLTEKLRLRITGNYTDRIYITIYMSHICFYLDSINIDHRQTPLEWQHRQ